MIFRDLAQLRAVVASIPTAPDQSEVVGPAVDPRLVTAYSPRATWRDGPGFGPASSQLFHTHHSDFAVDLPGWLPGLVIGRNSDTPSIRNGWKGITPHARRSIHRACAALEDVRSRLAFWTITLSPAQLDWIQRYDSWPAFQSAIRHRLMRALRRRGLRGLVIGVVELHPARTREEGRPCPHLHVVFVGRAHKWACWALTIADLDLVIVKALVAAQCFDLEVKACGNVQPVKKSVGAYLSHYLKKADASLGVCLGPAELCPRQWFFQSRPLLQLVRSLTVRLPLPFLVFIHDRWPELVDRGWGQWQQVEISDPRAPAVFTVLWESVAAVAAAICWWQESLWDAEWKANHRLLHDRNHPRQHPEPYQYLRAVADVGSTVLPEHRKRPRSQCDCRTGVGPGRAGSNCEDSRQP